MSKNESTNRSDAPACRIAIAVARFNREITDLLLDGCRQALTGAGVVEEHIEVFAIPGAWELPLACQKLAESERFDAVIALGAVVRGETAHFDFISDQCARGLQQVALGTGVPVAFGVLTPENAEQALERADPARKNKGREAAEAALDMIKLRQDISS